MRRLASELLSCGGEFEAQRQEVGFAGIDNANDIPYKNVETIIIAAIIAIIRGCSLRCNDQRANL